MKFICEKHHWDTIEDTEPCPRCRIDYLEKELLRVVDERDSYEKLYKSLLNKF